MSDQKNIKTLIIEKRRRLQKLKEQEARYGFSVEPSVLLEIEDIEAELEDLQLQLKALEAVAESPALESDSLASPSGEAITATVDENREYFSCFISYSHKDEAFAERLYADLQDKGVPCWYAPEDLRIGDKIRPRIDESIRQFDKLLLVLSEHSIDSLWVEHEVEAAFEKEMKHNTIMLFPIRLDHTVLDTEQAWAAEIRRTRHIGDFSRWKDHDAYQQAFERLLRDLKAENL